jgi:hypothetical protein
VGGRARLLRTSLNDSFFLWAMLDQLRVGNAYSGRDSQRSRYEIFCGVPYPASEDRVGGAFGHCWVPPEKRTHKGSPVSMPCVYVGKGVPGWRVIVGHGAAARFMDVTRATFYETPLISKGLMPSQTVLDAETQTLSDVGGVAEVAPVVLPVAGGVAPVVLRVAGRVAALAGAHALPAVPAPVIWQTPAAWAATLRPRRSSAVMLVVARSLQPRRSEMEMLAEASCVVEETELCSEGPALGMLERTGGGVHA